MSDTRKSGSHAAPENAPPPRHQPRKRRAGAKTESSYRLTPPDGKPPTGLHPKQLIPPQNIASAEATQKYRKGQSIAQRQKPQPADGQIEPARDDPGRQPAQRARDQNEPA